MSDLVGALIVLIPAGLYMLYFLWKYYQISKIDAMWDWTDKHQEELERLYKSYFKRQKSATLKEEEKIEANKKL